MKFQYIVISCKHENGKTIEFPVLFSTKMNGFEIQEALQRSDEVFEIYESNTLVSSGFVTIDGNGVKCEGHPEKHVKIVSDGYPELEQVMHSRGSIDEELIKKMGEK